MPIYELNIEAVVDASGKIEDDLLYNLFYGGYLDPEDLLADEKQAEEVRKAIRIVGKYVAQLGDAASELCEENDEEEE